MARPMGLTSILNHRDPGLCRQRAPLLQAAALTVKMHGHHRSRVGTHDVPRLVRIEQQRVFFHVREADARPRAQHSLRRERRGQR